MSAAILTPTLSPKPICMAEIMACMKRVVPATSDFWMISQNAWTKGSPGIHGNSAASPTGMTQEETPLAATREAKPAPNESTKLSIGAQCCDCDRRRSRR